MALTAFQRTICRLIAARRVASGESYVAGGAALNEALAAPRLSDDVDLFHDTADALVASFDDDRRALESAGCAVRISRRFGGFVEAEVSQGAGATTLQWTTDSAYRFFPLVEHPDFGLTLHPFDLATNKVLALVGRLEPRDWIDVVSCHERLQEFGLLAWAACGKDPGFSPASILAQAGRSARYTADEIDALSFHGSPPDAADLARRWHAMLDQAREIVALLPAEHAGKCVLDAGGSLFRGGPADVASALAQGGLRFHAGRIRGALPRVLEP